MYRTGTITVDRELSSCPPFARTCRAIIVPFVDVRDIWRFGDVPIARVPIFILFRLDTDRRHSPAVCAGDPSGKETLLHPYASAVSIGYKARITIIIFFSCATLQLFLARRAAESRAFSNDSQAEFAAPVNQFT